MSDDSDDDNIPIMELMKAHSQNDMLLETQCMVVVERMDAIPSVHQAQSLIASTQIEPDETQEDQIPHIEVQAYDLVQEVEESDEKPLDLSICVQRGTDVDIISISDTDEAPIIISDDSDNGTDTEFGRTTEDQEVVSFFSSIHSDR